MKKKLLVLIPFLCLLGFAKNANASFNIPAGTYYFDNTQTNWSTVYMFIGSGSYVRSYLMSSTGTSGIYSNTLGGGFSNATGYYFANNSGGVTAGTSSYYITTTPSSLPSPAPTSWSGVYASTPVAGDYFIPGGTSNGFISSIVTSLTAPANVVSGSDVMFYGYQSYGETNIGVTNNVSSTCITTDIDQIFALIGTTSTDCYIEIPTGNVPSTLSLSNNCGGWSGTGGFTSQTAANAAGARYVTGSTPSKTSGTSLTTSSASSTSIVSGTASITMTAALSATTGFYTRPLWVQYYVDGTLNVTSAQVATTSSFTTTLTTSSLSVGTHTIVPVITDRVIYYTGSSITLTVLNPPAITVSTSSLTSFGGVCIGSQSFQQSFTVSGAYLTANLVVTPPTGYEISQTNGSGYSSSAISLSATSGTVGTTTIYAVFDPASSGSIGGNITATSTGATTQNVSVTGTGNALPAITGNPSNPAAVGSGAGTATFTVTATGAGITYQWQENAGSGFSNITNGGIYGGATSATLTLTNATSSMNGYTYQCVVSGTCTPSQTSSSATLTVTSNTITTGTISGSPFCAGVGVTVPFTYSTAVSFPSGTCTFTAQLSPDNTFASPTSIGTVTSNGSGSQSISATIPSGTSTGTTYYIRVVSTSPTVTGASYGTTLTINGLPTITASPSTSAQTVCIGGSLTALSVTASAGGISYQWYYNASNSNSGGTAVSTGAGYTTASFTPSTSVASAFYYYCIVSGTCTPAVTSGVSGLITVQTTSVAGTASTAAICNGNTGTVSLSGNTGSIQWQQCTTSNGTFSNVTTGSGGTTTSYTTTALTTGLYYQASVTNGVCTAATSNVVLVSINQSNAASSTYGSSWTSGENDNTTGFGAWSLASVSGYSGFFTGTSGTSIDVSSKSWGLYANTNNTASAVRTLSSPMSVGQTLNFSMANGTVQSGGTVGFSLYNSSGLALMEFYFAGGSTYYTIHDNSGTPASTIGYTTSPMNIGLTYSSSSGQGAYALAITIGSTTYNYTGTFISQTSEVPDEIRFFNYNAGSGSPADFFVNSLSLNGPVITIQPSSSTQNDYVNATPTALTVTASGAGLSYQWYSNTSSSNSGGTSLGSGSGAQTNTYTPPTSSTGNTYYYCVVTGTCSNVTSNVSGPVVVSNNPPTITSFSTANNNGTSTSGYVGTTVTIIGTNLTSATALTVGGTSVFSNILTNTATSITFTSISGINGIISVTVGGVLGTSSSSYTDLGYLSVFSTDWNTGSTWLGGSVPAANANATIANAVTVTGSVTNAAGTVTINSSQSLTLSSSGALTVKTVINNGSVAITAGTLTISSAGTLTNNVSGGAVFSGGYVVFSGAGTINGTNAITFNNLKINGATTLTTIPTITDSLILNSGSYVTASPHFSGTNSVLNYNNGGGSSAKYNQSNEWPSTNSPSSVSITNNTWVQMTASRSLAGNLTVTDGTLQVTGGFLVILTMNGTSQTITISTLSGGAIYGTDNGTGNDLQLTIANGSTTTLAGDATSSADDEKKFFNVAVNAGGTLALGRGILCKYGTFTVNGTLQINAHGYIQSASGVAASYSSGYLIYNTGGSYTATDYEWPATTNTPKSVTVESSTSIVMNDSKTVPDSLILNNATLTLGAYSLTMGGISSTSGTLTTTSSSSIAFVSSFAGPFSLPSSVSSLSALTINNTNATPTTISLGGALTITTLTLTSGKLDIGSNNLTVSTLSGGSSSSYIVTSGTGTVTKNAITANLTLPIGTSSYYAPLQFATATSSNMTVGVSTSFTHAPVNSSAVVGLQWSMLASGSYTSNVTFQYNAGNQGSGYTSTGAILGTYASSYVESGLGTVTGAGPYTVTASSLTLPTSSADLYGIGDANSFTYNVPGVPTSVSALDSDAAAIIFFTAPTNTGGATITSYTVTSTPGSVTASGSSSPIKITGLTNGTTYTFSVTAANSVGTGAASAASNSVTPSATTTWNGITWSAGPPTSVSNAVVAANLNNTQWGGATSVARLTISSGITFGLTGAVTITGSPNVNGAPFQDSGAISGGTIILAGSVAQTISGIGLVNNFTVNNSNGASVISGSNNLGIAGVLTLQSGTFATNGNVTLKSLSIANTGILAPVGTSGNSGGITGNVTVERYIPQGFRAYRDISPEVYGAGSIFNNWQEGGAVTSGAGIFITGSGATDASRTYYSGTTTGYNSSNGLDYSINGIASAFNFTNGTWNTGITNTKTTNLDAFQGYRVLVRGDRSFNLESTPITNTQNGLRMLDATKFVATGQLVTGAVTYSTTGVTNTATGGSTFTLNSTSNGYSMIANPYACPVLWGTGTGTNGSNTVYGTSSNLNGTFWYLDGTHNATGSYVAYNALSGSVYSDETFATGYIQPGQAFFIQNTSTAPSVVFTESTKAAGSTKTSVFGTPTLSKIYVSLWKNSSTGYERVDGAALAFSEGFTDTTYGPQDAVKFGSAYDNLYIADKGEALSIDGRLPAKASDSIAFRISYPSTKLYQLKIDASNYIDEGFSPVLYDKYTKTTTAIGVLDSLGFTIDTAITATYANRFIILFIPSPLAVNSIFASAVLNDKVATITWSTVGEKGESYYQVEKSTDGINFTSIDKQTAKNTASASYMTTDKNVATGNNYYRIKAVSEVGTVSYSNVAKLTYNISLTTYSLYPNPLKGRALNVQLSNVAAGKYVVSIYNALGQKVNEQSINHAGGSGSYALIINSALAGGIYSVAIRDEASKQQVCHTRLSVQP